MPVFSCSGCDKRLSIGEEFSGRQIQCPYCGKSVTAPSLELPVAEEVGQAIHGDRPALGELAAALRQPAPAAPPRSPARGQAMRGPAYRRGAAGGYVGTNIRYAERTSGLAIASMIMGILSLISYCLGPLFGILALIFGSISMSTISRTPGLGGRGMALAGIIMGLIGAALWGLSFAVGIVSMTHFTR